jgi:hypothetical protein
MFGPDGKPINIGAGQLIGGPKSLDDVAPFNDETITALEAGALQMLQSGQPMEVPAAMPMGQIIQIAKTLVVQRARIAELEARVEELEGTGGKTDNGVEAKLDLSNLLSYE